MLGIEYQSCSISQTDEKSLSPYLDVNMDNEYHLANFKREGSIDQAYREYDPPSNFACASDSWKEGRPTLLYSWCRCALYSFIMTIICGATTAVFPTFLIWFDVNLGSICRNLLPDWYKMPKDVQTTQLIWGIISCVFNQCWHFSIILPVFGWKLIKQLNLLPWALIFSSTDAIYRLLIHVYHNFDNRTWEPYPRYIIFLGGILFSSYRIASHFEQKLQQRLQLTFKLGAQFYTCAPAILVINFVLFHYFGSLSESYKSVVASLSPVLIIIPKTVARLCAEKMDGLNHPGTSVLLVIALHAGSPLLFRILQAKLESPRMYFILSIVHGIESTFDKVTLPFQDYILQKCCKQQQQHRNSREIKSRVKRLLADLAIVSMIAESSAIFASSAVFQIFQCYYRYDDKAQNYDAAKLLKNACFRIAIGVIIEFLFNTIAIKMQTYYYNIPVIRVWKVKKFWIIGMFLLHALMPMVFFGGIFYNALQTKGMFQKKMAQNCTLPFHVPLTNTTSRVKKLF